MSSRSFSNGEAQLQPQLLAQLLDFSSTRQGVDPQFWHLSPGWKWDPRGPLGQVHNTAEDFRGVEYPDFTPEKNVILGSGVAGEVRRVLCNGKILALKKTNIDPRSRNMLQNIEEVNTSKQLSHPHISQLCGIYVLGTNLYSLYYPVAEMDLGAFMALNQTSNPSWVNTLLGGVGCLSSALAYSHSLGIKHKDIHPGNILVLGSALILCDWGASSNSYGRKKHASSSDERRYRRSRDINHLGLVFADIVQAVAWKSTHRHDKLPKPEKILRSMSSGKKSFSRFDLDCLIEVMTTDELKQQASASAVAEYLREGSYAWGFRHGIEGNGGEVVSETCGRCCSSKWV